MSKPVIKIDGVDWTDRIVIKDAEFVSAANGAAGSCHFRFKDADQSITVVTGNEITLDVDGSREWGGWVMQVKRGFFFDVTQDPATHLVPRSIEVLGSDYNFLFGRRYLRDPVTPSNGKLLNFPDGAHDDDVIKTYIDAYLNLSGDGISTDGVDFVAALFADANGFYFSAGMAWGTLMSIIATQTGAIWYLDPDKTLIYTDIDTPDGPFGITSYTPDPGEIGCRELQIVADGTQLLNDVYLLGMGQGSAQRISTHLNDSFSVAVHGLWEYGAIKDSVWEQATLDLIASTYVFGSPTNRRGGADDRISIKCAIFEPGIRVGQKVNVRGLDYNSIIPVRSVRITFPTPTDARFDLSLSFDIDQPWNLLNTMPFLPLPDVNIGDRIQIHIPGPGNSLQYIDDFERNTAPWRLGDAFGLYASWGLASSGYYWPDSAATGYFVVEDGVGKVQAQGSDEWHAWSGDLPWPLGIVSDTLWIWSAPSLMSDSGYSFEGGPNPGDPNPGGTAFFLNANDEFPFDPLGYPYNQIRVDFNGSNFDTLFRTRIQTEPSNFRIKTWLDTDPEPSSWDFDTADAFPIAITSLKVGVYVNALDLGAELWIASISSYYGGAQPGITGWICNHPTRIPTPSNDDPSKTYYQMLNRYAAGSMTIYVDGLLLYPNKYDEFPRDGTVALHSDVNVGGGDAFDPPKVVYACYLAG